MYQDYPPPYWPSKIYITLDALFVLFSILYLIGDADHLDNALKYVKAFPIWIMVIELYPLRNIQHQIPKVIIGLLFGSVGDMLLLWSQKSFAFFALGGLSFLIGHLFYVTAFVMIAEDLVPNKVQINEVLRIYPVYLVIWLLLVFFSFFSISTLNGYLSSSDPVRFVLDLYGTILVLLAMGGFFFFFTSHSISSNVYWAGLLLMFGSLIFFASDNFLAHGKYNTWYKQHVTASTNSYLIMITYYMAQFLIGKGAFLVTLHYTEDRHAVPQISH